MVPDFVVNSADGADASITLPVITSPVTGANSLRTRGGYSLVPRLCYAITASTRRNRGANACHNLARFRCR
jgi:hypothetical protein